VTRERIVDLYALNRADLLPKARTSAPISKAGKAQGAGGRGAGGQGSLSVRSSKSTATTSCASWHCSSRRVGEILEQLLEMVVEDPHLNDRDTLLLLIRKMGRSE